MHLFRGGGVLMQETMISDWKGELRALVMTYYDVQKVRIASYNRTLQIASYMHIPGIADEDIAIRRKAVSKWLTEYLGESNPESMEKVETGLAKRIEELLAQVNRPIYYELISVRGIGPILAGGLMSYFDPYPHWSTCQLPPRERCKPPEGFDRYGSTPPCEHATWINPEHPSSFWKYAGLHVVEVDGKMSAPKMAHGQKVQWNPAVRTLLWKISDSFIKQRTPVYRTVYDRVKEREVGRLMDTEKGWKGHADARARRAMVKRFLADFWEHYRKSENLSISDPYVLEKMGHTRDDLGDGIRYAVGHRIK